MFKDNNEFIPGEFFEMFDDQFSEILASDSSASSYVHNLPQTPLVLGSSDKIDDSVSEVISETDFEDFCASMTPTITPALSPSTEEQNVAVTPPPIVKDKKRRNIDQITAEEGFKKISEPGFFKSRARKAATISVDEEIEFTNNPSKVP